MKKSLFGKTAWLALLFLIFICPLVYAGSLREIFENALKAYSQGESQKAIDLLKKITEVNPNFAPAYNYLGLAHKQGGTNIEEVAWFFKKAVEIDPRYADPYENLGKIYYGLGEFDKAVKYTLDALQIKPNLATSQLSLGWIYLLGKSQPKSAIKYFTKSLENNPSAYGQFGLGMAYFMDHQNHRTLEMITALRKAGQDNLAEELEKMVRNKTYIPITQIGNPLIQPANDESSLAQNKAPDFDQTEPQADMPVRLRGKNRRTDGSNEGSSKALSPQEQIEALQQRSRYNSNDSPADYGYQ